MWSTKGLLVSGVRITFKKTTGEQGTLQTDHFAGGFYSGTPIPGTYTITIESGQRYNNSYRPMIISQVMIKPGVRTILNIIMKPGDALERISAPQMQTQPLTLVAK